MDRQKKGWKYSIEGKHLFQIYHKAKEEQSLEELQLVAYNKCIHKVINC